MTQTLEQRVAALEHWKVQKEQIEQDQLASLKEALAQNVAHLRKNLGDFMKGLQKRNMKS